MVTFMEEVLSKVFKPLLIALGGWLVIAIYNRIMFWKRCKYYLRVQKKNNSVMRHYVAYLYCHGYDSTLNGRRLALKQKVAGVDEALLEELKDNLRKCDWTFGNGKCIANNVVKHIDTFLGIHRETLDCLEKGETIVSLSKQLLDSHLIICHFLETLLERKCLEEGDIIENRYNKHNLEMNPSKIPRFFRGYDVYINGKYYK